MVEMIMPRGVMHKDPVFRALAEVYLEHMVAPTVKYVNGTGQVMASVERGLVAKEGEELEHNEGLKGFLLIRNHGTIDELCRKGVIDEAAHQPRKNRTLLGEDTGALKRFVLDHAKEDGAFYLHMDVPQGAEPNYATFIGHVDSDRLPVADYTPSSFLKHAVPNSLLWTDDAKHDEAGTKIIGRTRVALLMPHVHKHTRNYALKATHHGYSRMPSMVMSDKKGFYQLAVETLDTDDKALLAQNLQRHGLRLGEEGQDTPTLGHLTETDIRDSYLDGARKFVMVLKHYAYDSASNSYRLDGSRLVRRDELDCRGYDAKVAEVQRMQHEDPLRMRISELERQLAAYQRMQPAHAP